MARSRIFGDPVLDSSCLMTGSAFSGSAFIRPLRAISFSSSLADSSTCGVWPLA